MLGDAVKIQNGGKVESVISGVNARPFAARYGGCPNHDFDLDRGGEGPLKILFPAGESPIG
jgi:hypothetical protein